MPAPRPGPVDQRVLVGDVLIAALCIVAMFLLLASPLVPIMFDFTGLTFLTLLLGIPLAAVGVVLNHRAAQHVGTKRR